jgi:D-amino-acid dehydrogenase
LCQYSQRCLNEVVQEEGIEYEAVNKGVIYLYRDGRHLEAGAANMQLLAEHGQKIEVLDAGQVVGLEPVFQPVEHKIAGAIYGLTDASGDAQLFSKNLSKVCEALGATFHLGTRARGLIAEGDLVTGVVTQDGILTADNYVLSLGVESPAIAKTIGVRIPIYPAKGYSVTFPLGDEHTPPSIGGVDEELLVAWSRLGSNLRMTSTAEFCGHDRTWNAKDFSNIFKLARDLLPNGADYSAGRYRACLRPMTPDGPPVIGLGRHRNLYYNTGHGHMGWTMACGSSRAVVDVMLARDAGIDLTGHKFRW